MITKEEISSQIEMAIKDSIGKENTPETQEWIVRHAMNPIINAYGECARDVVKISVVDKGDGNFSINIYSDGSFLGDAILLHMAKLQREMEAEDRMLDEEDEE